MGDLKFYSPINGSIRISSFYGSRNSSVGSKYHRGIDMVPKDGQAAGTAVLASAVGKVVSIITNNEKYGNMVVVEHQIEGGYIYTLYAHMQDNSIPSTLQVGQEIGAGQ